MAKPDTILAWYRKLIAKKFDGSKHRHYPGRPPIEPKLEVLIVQMAGENSGWGYDRIVGALANLGYTVSDQTVGNVLRRHRIAPAPKRSQNPTWKEFIQSHLAVLAGIDFFTVEVLNWRGLVTYYVLFFIHLESRRISLAGITRHPGARSRFWVPITWRLVRRWTPRNSVAVSTSTLRKPEVTVTVSCCSWFRD